MQIQRHLPEWGLRFRLSRPSQPFPDSAALTGVGVAFPIITAITAFSLLVGTGGAPLCSIARGKGDEERAEHIMGNSFLMTLVLGVVLLVTGLLVKDSLLYALGASKATFGYAISWGIHF